MSFHKLDAVIQSSTLLTPAQKLVLAYLNSCAATTGYAWPSYEVIMRECGIGSRGTITKALKAFETKGFVKIIHGERKGSRNKSNRYRIIPQAEPIKQKKETSLIYDLSNEIAVAKHKSTLQINSLKAARAMLDRSGAMDLAIGLAIAEKLKELTTHLSTL